MPPKKIAKPPPKQQLPTPVKGKTVKKQQPLQKQRADPTTQKQDQGTPTIPTVGMVGVPFSSHRLGLGIVHRHPSTPSSRSRSGSGDSDSHLMTQMLSSLSEENFKNFQRLHLVIDLDSTFVSTRTDESSYHRAVKLLKTTSQGEETLQKRVYLFSIGGTRMWTILRPGSLEFIEFASFYFKRISVWSAGQKDYVDQIVSFLFPAHIPRPSIVFNWDDCAQEVTSYSSVEDTDVTYPSSAEVDGSSNSYPSGEEKSDEGRKAASPSNQEFISFTKPLIDMIPHAPKGESIEYMLILDDRKDIAEKNIDNLVQIPPYEPSITLNALSSPDNALDKFVEWLMRPEVINTSDIRKIDKSRIFFTSSSLSAFGEVEPSRLRRKQNKDTKSKKI